MILWILKSMKAKGHSEEELSLELVTLVRKRDEGNFHRFLASLKASAQEDLAGVP